MFERRARTVQRDQGEALKLGQFSAEIPAGATGAVRRDGSIRGWRVKLPMVRVDGHRPPSPRPLGLASAPHTLPVPPHGRHNHGPPLSEDDPAPPGGQPTNCLPSHTGQRSAQRRTTRQTVQAALGHSSLRRRSASASGRRTTRQMMQAVWP
ncbi:MAG: hypothetical protein KGK07_13400, partial [Chloroflexota bacterium]|nr:hypothetical protein [Chloroflexota bacterium]